MKRIALADHCVLRLGPAARETLQGYSTQTPHAARGAFVDLHGRTVAVYRRAPEASDGSALLLLSRGAAGKLTAHLDKYLVLTGARLMPESLRVYFAWDGTPEEDPEHALIPEAGGTWILSGRDLPDTAAEEAFTKFRLDHAMPLQGRDYFEEMVLNLADPELVSWTKGCYLGQEIVARTHYRGRPPRRLEARALDLGDEERTRATSLWKDPETGRVFGFEFVPNP